MQKSIRVRTQKELRDKLEFVELVETFSNETVKPLTYKFFDLVEQMEEVKVAVEDLHTTYKIEKTAEKKI